jgi:hypothetical protein
VVRGKVSVWDAFPLEREGTFPTILYEILNERVVSGRKRPDPRFREAQDEHLPAGAETPRTKQVCRHREMHSPC